MTEKKARRAVILGATSAMAEQTARLLAAEGARLSLVARDPHRLEAICADLTTRGAGCAIPHACDLADVENPDSLLGTLAASIGGLDAVLIFYGVLGDQQQAEHETQHLRHIVRVNFTSAAEWAIAAARALESGDSPNPVLMAIGSVAGDRGRASNYVYGAAKAGLAAIFQGLAHEYGTTRLRVVLVKSGSVITPMTDGFQRKGLTWARPEQMAAIIRKLMDRGGPIAYAPSFWRWIMLVIRSLPHSVMKRLKI